MLKQRIFPREVYEFAANLGTDLSDIYKLHAIECGLHGGIPHCCIAFYVLVWNTFGNVLCDPSIKHAHPTVKVIVSDYQAAMRCRFGAKNPRRYVACTACLFNPKFAKLKKCDCGSKWCDILHEYEPVCDLGKPAEQTSPDTDHAK